MASHPDANPDSRPGSTSDNPERVSPSDSPQRESVEDSPGTDGGTSGTGGTNHMADRDITS